MLNWKTNLKKNNNNNKTKQSKNKQTNKQTDKNPTTYCPGFNDGLRLKVWKTFSNVLTSKVLRLHLKSARRFYVIFQLPEPDWFPAYLFAKIWLVSRRKIVKKMYLYNLISERSKEREKEKRKKKSLDEESAGASPLELY